MTFYREDIIQMEPIYTPPKINFNNSYSTLDFFDIDLEKHKADNIEQIEITEKDSEWIKLQNTPIRTKNVKSLKYRKFWFILFVINLALLLGLYHFFKFPSIQIGGFYIPDESAGLQINTSGAEVVGALNLKVVSKNYFDIYCNEISIVGFLLDDNGLKIENVQAVGNVKGINFPAYSKTTNTMPLVINYINQQNMTALTFLSAKIKEMGSLTIKYRVEIKFALISWTGYTYLMDDSIRIDLKDLDQGFN